MTDWNDHTPDENLEDEPQMSEGVNAHHAYDCAFCGESNEVFVDGSGARTQRFTEDCQVCCRPNLLSITIHYDGVVNVDVEREYDA